jgi:hypothetical protein
MQRAPSYARTVAAKKSKNVSRLSIRSRQERAPDWEKRFYLIPFSPQEVELKIEDFAFGSIRIDGITHEHDVVIEGGEIHKRKKKLSKRFRDDFGHTPLSVEEDIPWKCRRLVIGTGAYGKLPVMTEVKREAERRKVELVIVPTAAAIEELRRNIEDTNAILHVTC